ncbi:MAG TPA: hypothetical protein VFA20_09030 [Myxococcaceae bacterium]|nr:hypothetical protein [Myxococcaceae bacterium]
MHGNARIAALLALVSITSWAAEEPAPRAGQGWTLLGAQTVGDGANVVAVEAGFPALAVTFFHGVTSIEDVGVRLAFNYGFEGLVSAIVPGMRVEGLARLRLLDTGHVNIGLRGGVGVFAYFTGAFTVPGVTIPLGLDVGIPVGSAFAISTGVGLPLFITFGNTGGLTAPILFDAGLEYWLSKAWEANLHARMGPALNATSPFVQVGSAQIAFELSVGMAFKL